MEGWGDGSGKQKEEEEVEEVEVEKQRRPNLTEQVQIKLQSSCRTRLETRVEKNNALSGTTPPTPHDLVPQDNIDNSTCRR